jgi:rhodanese-related sulfurtransferase
MPDTSPPEAGSATPMPISASELQARLLAGEAIQLVDVREDNELELAQLAHPVLHLPLSRSQDWIGRIDTLIERQQPVAVLCHAGVRSWHFGCWLIQEHGHPQVWNLQGGIDAWSTTVDRSVPRY